MAISSGNGDWSFPISATEFGDACGEISSWTLLTGAGFSANWGAPVADGIWSEIIHDRRLLQAPTLRKELLKLSGFDFEDVLGRAQEHEFEPSEAKILFDAVFTAYVRIEEILHRAGIGQPSADLESFFDNFRPSGPVETSFIFTLNQDLLLERQFKVGHGNASFSRPGIDEKSLDGVDVAPGGKGVPNGFVTPVVVDRLSDSFSLNELRLRKRANYIKLHGSVDWRRQDQEAAVIIGGKKLERIQKYPLLAAYHAIFKQTICRGEQRLMIIGYAFGDVHINSVIACNCGRSPGSWPKDSHLGHEITSQFM